MNQLGRSVVWTALIGSILCAGCSTFDFASRSARAPLASLEGPLSRAALANDPKLVLRDRLDLAGPDRSDTIQGTSFSHRSQRYHVYPFTTYGASRVEVRLEVRDPEMARRAGVWVLGPRQDDGSWARIRGALGSEARVAIEAEGLDDYLVVVGPRDRGAFLPRYPGSEALLELETDDGFEEENGAIEWRSGSRVLVFEGVPDPDVSPLAGRSFRIEDPLAEASRVDQVPDDAFDLLFATECADSDCSEETGETLAFAPRAWTRFQLYSPEDATSLSDTRLGSLHDPQEDFFTLYSASSPHRPETTYQILEAIGSDGDHDDVDPALVRVVPLRFGACEVDVVESSPCARTNGSCRTPICLGTGEPAPPGLPVSTFRATALDFDEDSIYDLSARCEGDCSPTAPPTRYPVYFAHGFNSSKQAWDGITEALIEGDPRWSGWLAAKSVPPFEPVWRRAEALRRNLAEFLTDLEARNVEPPAGEPFQRLNVVAHSMGGLDSRYLVGHEKYNHASCHTSRECTDRNGDPVPCCHADADGNAIPWRERLASVTTLSTPHRGSSFADLGVSLLERRSVDWLFRKAARYVLGLDTEEDQQHLRDTLFTLSNEFARETMTPEFPPLQPERVYSFACVSGAEVCDVPADADVPNDPTRLPAPNELATFFAWASEACMSGTCGSIVDPGLALPWSVVKRNEGPGDGVVAIDSARFGIFMGVRANDHFQWNRLSVAQVVALAARAFGIKREPVDRFHTHWLGTLAKSGY